MRAEALNTQLADSSEIDHWVRVAALADAVTSRLRWDEARREVTRLGAVLHDVGKLTVSRMLLNKPGPLTDDERITIQRHPAAGALLICPRRSMRKALPCIFFHHERWDGEGYPTRRAGAEIPIEARLLAIADAFDAMVSDRPYRGALSIGDALDEVERGAGTQFDPELAEEFVGWQMDAADLRARKLAVAEVDARELYAAATGSPTPRALTVSA